MPSLAGLLLLARPDLPPRTLRDSPGQPTPLALAVILTLAIGTGATTAIFAVVDAGLERVRQSTGTYLHFL
jgi:hypothetical protein